MKNLFGRGKVAVGMIAAGAMLTACGGGGDVAGLGGGDTGGSASMSLTKAEVTPASVGTGQQVAVHWTVAYSTPAVGYSTEFHLNSQPALIQGMSGLTRVFYANGDMGPTTVGKDATVSCTLQSSYGRPVLNCGTYGSRYLDTFDLTKPLYGIFKACTYDAGMNQVCDTKATGPITFSSTVALAPAELAPEQPVQSGTPITGTGE